MASVTTARPTGPPNQPKNWSEAISSKGSGKPSRTILHGIEGVGKTSFAANSTKPIFLMLETGLESLIDAGRLSDIPHFPEITSWTDLLSVIEHLTVSEHDHKTVVIDTLNGAERKCHEHVCHRDFNDDWGSRGFANYHNGFDVSVTEWLQLLAALDKLRDVKRMGVIALCHTDVKTYKNPLGPDYDRFRPALHDKTWNATNRWADHVLFANFHVEVATDNAKAKKGKGLGGNDRVMYTTRTAAWDAKNRAGLTDEIDMGSSGKEAWENFIQAVKNGRTQD
jgi:hypothetical protein